MWPGGNHPMLFAESSCVCTPNFSPVTTFFGGGGGEVLMLFFKNTDRGVAI